MPVIKVWNINREIKKTVLANTLEELKVKGIEKLGLLAVNGVKVLLESDGSEIEDDEVFQSLVEDNRNIPVFQIIPEDLVWQKEFLNLSAPESSELSLSSSSRSSPLSHLFSPQPSPVGSLSSPYSSESESVVTTHFEIPWEKFPQSLTDCLQSGATPSKTDFDNLVRKTVKQLTKSYSGRVPRAMLSQVAQRIVTRYPFLGSANTIKPHETLFLKLENRMANSQRSKKCLGLQHLVKEKNLSVRPSKRKQYSAIQARDSYGCVLWQPDGFAAGETFDTQEEKKAWLKSYFVDQIGDEQTVLNYMHLTYTSQRITINTNKCDISAVLCEWPLLATELHFTNHFNTLVGFILKEQWASSLSEKLDLLITYFRSLRGVRQHRLGDCLQRMDEAIVAQKSNEPKEAALIPLLQQYFNEEESVLIQKFEKTTSIKEVIERVDNSSPTIAFLGDSVFSDSTLGIVVVEKKPIGDLAPLRHLVPVLFAAFYVFNLQYPSGGLATLEFIQRVIMNINPSQGERRSGKQAKCVTHPKVLALLNALRQNNPLWCLT